MTHGLSLIWAQAAGGVIGVDGRMPWHLPEDLAHFKHLTVGHPVIMGRRTWDSIEPRFRPLVDRRNVVVTRDLSWTAQGAEVAHTVESAVDLAGHGAWVVGGSQLYAATIAHAHALEVTEIDADFKGDTYAPPIDDDWQVASIDPDVEWHTSRTGLAYRFIRYERAPR